MKKEDSLSKNIFYMVLLQATNYLVPIVLIPILISRIQLENYGLIILAQAIMIILMSVGDFGFNLTGSRLISQNGGNKIFIREVSTKIFRANSLMLLVAFSTLVILVFIIPFWAENRGLILTSFLMVIGQVLLPVWYYQGTQRIKVLTFLNSISKLIYFLLILFFINHPEDFILVNILNGLAGIIVSGLAWLIIYIELPRNISTTIAFKNLLLFIKSNSSIFLSNFINESYRGLSIILAGFYLSDALLGIYGIFDKIIQLINNSFAAVFRAIFPKISSLINTDIKKVHRIYRLYYVRMGVLTLGGVVILLIYGGMILSILSKEFEAVPIQSYMFSFALIPVMIYLNLPCSVTLLAMDLKRNYLISNLLGFIVHLVCSAIAVPFFNINGLLLSYFFSQLILFCYSFYQLRKRNFSFF